MVNSFNDDLIKLIRLSNDIESKIQLTRFFGETNSFFDMGVYESKILENKDKFIFAYCLEDLKQSKL